MAVVQRSTTKLAMAKPFLVLIVMWSIVTAFLAYCFLFLHPLRRERRCISVWVGLWRGRSLAAGHPDVHPTHVRRHQPLPIHRLRIPALVPSGGAVGQHLRRAVFPHRAGDFRVLSTCNGRHPLPAGMEVQRAQLFHAGHAPWQAQSHSCFFSHFGPLLIFSTLVRVDMLAVALAFTGIALTTISLSRPNWLYAAVACFVAALFTKQTYLAGPAAAFILLFVRDPRRTVLAFGFGVVVAAAMFAAFDWDTSGGFFNHLFRYNVNRFSARHFLVLASSTAIYYAIFVTALAVSLVWVWRTYRRGASRIWLPSIMTAFRSTDRTAIYALMTLYCVASAALTILSGKTGSSSNYFLESMATWCFWLGALVARQFEDSLSEDGNPDRMRRAWTIILPCAFVLQVSYVPGLFDSLQTSRLGPEQHTNGAALVALVRQSNGPVLSDDLALPMLAGREVPIEPYLFAELGNAGFWNENFLVDMIQERKFGAIITFRSPGDRTFDERFFA